MKIFRNLWWLGAVAAVAACDPYDDERGGEPEILEVIASGGDSAHGVVAMEQATGGGTAPWVLSSTSICTAEVEDDPDTEEDESVPQRVKPDAGVIFVKVNKLLDGATIQATPESCAPANDWLTVTRDGVADAAAWYTCYSPSGASEAEGASIVLYRGGPVSGGYAGEIWLDQAYDAGATDHVVEYVLTGSVTDKQGNPVDISIQFNVEPDAGALGDVTVDRTAKTITWEAAECLTGTESAATGGYAVYYVDPDEDPVLLGEVGAGVLTIDDAAMTADREYLIAPIIADVDGAPYETPAQGPFD